MRRRSERGIIHIDLSADSKDHLLMATKKVAKSRKKSVKNSAGKVSAAKAGRAKYPRQSVEKALRIPKAIVEQNAGKPCTVSQAAAYLGRNTWKGPFSVEISSATKYGFLESPESGVIKPTDLARRILRPTSAEDQVKAYREAILNAPEISDVYKHYRGENIPDATFFKNTLTQQFKIPDGDADDFKEIFLESLESAKLLEKHGDNTRVLDVSTEVAPLTQLSDHIKKLGAAVAVKTGGSCFVMQPFAAPHGDYFEKILKPAIEKTGLKPVRADADIFGTGKIIDQIWRGINGAQVLVAELSTRNANVLYELGLAHALKKPVVLISSNQPDVPFDLKHIRVIYYDVTDPFWGTKLIDKVAENILSALKNPEEAIFQTIDER
jgi:hypothetical protein